MERREADRATGLTVSLFGTPRIAVDGLVRRFAAPPRTLPLLALLALHRPEAVRRRRLGALLWPDSAEDAVLAHVRRHLHYLDRALEAMSVVATPVARTSAELSLAADVWTDTAAFENALAAGQLEEAADLYRGDLFETCADEWIAPYRSHYRTLYESALDRIRQGHLARRDFTAAASWAQRALELDPYRENVVRDVLIARLGLGDRAGALRAYETFRSLLAVELGCAPMPETVALAEAIAGGDVLQRGAALPSARPIAIHAMQPAQSIGRDGDLLRARAALEDARVLTITGPPGVGKTHLAMHLVRTAPGTAHVVELGAAPNADAALALIARSAGIDVAAPGDFAHRVLAALPRQSLLVLDNCEHVLDAIAEFAARFSTAGSSKILATGRERLAIAAECVYRLEPLAVPPSGERLDPTELVRYPAVEFFVEHAARGHARFALDAGNVAQVAEICRRLDGLPLALELAAARVASLGTRELAARLPRSLDLLKRRGRGHTHESMRAAIAWSYRLLDDDEGLAFSRLSTFVGSFTLEAAQDVISFPPLDRQRIAGLVGTLVDRSLLTVVPDERFGHRYRLLEPVREFAAHLLASSDDGHAIRRRRLQYYEHFARTGADASGTVANAGWARQADGCIADLEAALTSAFESGDGVAIAIEIVAFMRPYWYVRAPLGGLQWIARARRVAESELAPSTRAALDLAESSLAYVVGRYREAMAAGARAVATFAELGDDSSLARALQEQGHAMCRIAQSEGEILLERALEIFRRTGRTFAIAGSVNELGVAKLDRGDLAGARCCLAEANHLARTLRDDRLTAGTLVNLGVLEHRLGNVDASIGFMSEALPFMRRSLDDYQVAVNLNNIAILALEIGEIERARAALLDSFDALRDSEPGSVQFLVAVHQTGSFAAATERYEPAARLLGFVTRQVGSLSDPESYPERDGLAIVRRRLIRALGARRAGGLFEIGALLAEHEAIDLVRTLLASNRVARPLILR